MKTQTFKSGENMVMVEGDVYLLKGIGTAAASTKENFGSMVTHIPREWFVKGVDVEELARKESEGIINPASAAGFYSGYINGYNANKNEFTREEMEIAMRYVFVNNIMGNENFVELRDKAISELRPLTLPKSLTVTEDFKLVKIEW